MPQVSPNGSLATRNGEIPCEGQKTIPFVFDFAANTDYTVDCEQLQQTRTFTSVQSAYIDNSLNGSTVVLIVENSGQRIVIPPNACAYVPLLAPTPARILFQSAGLFVVKAQLMNFYIPPAVWKVT